ncbi:MAG: DUF4349 domain-containing protein [Anaerolineae bacterium]
MRGYIPRLIAALLVTLMLGGCGAANNSSSGVAQPAEPMYERGIAPEGVIAVPTQAAGAREAPLADQDGSLPAPEDQALQERMIVRNADIIARVEDVPTAIGQLRTLAEGAGGYIVSQSTWEDGENTNATITIRVPAERFDQVLEQVNGLSRKVISSSVTGQDVTEEYVDIESRLKALRATEEQLLLLLEDVRERMKTAEDILAVYRELQNVQSQIEQLEGRQTYLERMVAMSTINLTLYPPEADIPVVAEGWQPLRTAREALHSLSSALQGLVNLVIWLALFVLPIVLVFAIPFVLLVVVIRVAVRSRRGKRTAAAVEPPSQPA